MRRGIVRLALPFVALAFATRAAPATEAPTVEQLQANPELLQQRYDRMHSLTVEEYYFRGDLKPGEPQPNEAPYEFYNEDLYVVRNAHDVLYVKKQAFRHPDLTFIPLKAGVPVVCLSNPSGANGWRANPWFVVLQNPLKLLGQVSDAGQDLVVVDDVWESGWMQLDHATAPAAAVLYRVENGALAVDKGRTEEWAWRKVSELNAKILEVHANAVAAMAGGKSADPELFSAILSKFLHYRILNFVDPSVTSGWDKLKKDLRAFDPQKFPVGPAGGTSTTPIEEIEQRITKSLEARGSLEQDLKKYTSAPLAP